MIDRLFRAASALVLLTVLGCTPAPAVTTGKFDTSHTLTMQRGSVSVVVETSGPATFKITDHRMDHPMDRRPDTEAEYKTPAGTFKISNREQQGEQLTINGKLFEVPPAGEPTTITIDAKGGITMVTPKAKDAP